MDLLTVDELRMILSFIRFLLFFGIMLFFGYIRTRIPQKDKGVLTLIIGFAILAFASLFNSQAIFPDWLPLLNTEFGSKAIILMSHLGYILGTLTVVFGLIYWSNSVVKLHYYAKEAKIVRDQISDQNALLQETTRDLEIRTIDYLEQREAAIESERSKTNFLRNTSHELRTPLNAIIGLSELLANGTYKNEEERAEFSNMILSSGKNLLKTINTILEISRIQSDEYTPSLKAGEIKEIIDECVAHCLPKAHSKSIKISVLLKEENKVRAIFDTKAMRHILIRIIDNALTYSPEDTEITIRAVMSDQEQVKIVIVDQGPGIDPEFIDNIFEVFGRAEHWKNRGEGGAGLGLALSSKMAEIQNGKLEIESDGVNGTTCSISLPACA
ncbi:MAG: HAMP domain-containing histidine kinase [Sneathiella sp.]|nr:HAMP domain-containing histidine kinase [Sneathiella sp.]